MSRQPVAVFDSGMGGLSVVRHLRHLLPREDLVYFGDTARVPYGSKSRQTVITFALEAARFLLQFEPKVLVAACNTASALAMDELRRELPVPTIGVVEPGAEAAVKLADGGTVAVIGTEATVGSGAYLKALGALAPHLPVVQRACPLFVPLVEEGRGPGDSLVKLAVGEYLAPMRDSGVAVLILGCTHYPMLRDAIAAYMGPAVKIVDSGRETALVVQQHLRQLASLCPWERRGRLSCYVSDNPARFRSVGSRFLDETITDVEFVEPERYISSGVRAGEPG